MIGIQWERYREAGEEAEKRQEGQLDQRAGAGGKGSHEPYQGRHISHWRVGAGHRRDQQRRTSERFRKPYWAQSTCICVWGTGGGEGRDQKSLFFLMKPRKQWKYPVGTQRATPPEVNSPGHKCSQELGKRHLMWCLCPQGGFRLFREGATPCPLKEGQEGHQHGSQADAGQQNSLSDAPFWLEPGWVFSSLSSPNQ